MTFGIGSIQLGFCTIVFTQYMQRCFQYKCYYTFQSNCAESLHFSALVGNVVTYIRAKFRHVAEEVFHFPPF